jgi:hypothetical protein
VTGGARVDGGKPGVMEDGGPLGETFFEKKALPQTPFKKTLNFINHKMGH